MKKLLIFILALSVTALFAEEVRMPPLTITTAQSNGMGGHHTAYTDNVFALLVNPAAIMRVEQRSFFALSPTLISPQATFELVDGIVGLVGGDGDISALADAASRISKTGNIPFGFEIREFPFSIAWVADGFGFGLWNRIFVNPSIVGMSLDADVYADLMLPVGFAFKILETDAHTVDAGVTVKPFVRAKAQLDKKIVDLIDSDEAEKAFKEIAVPLIAGAGLDIGFMYRWDIGLSAGLTFKDIVTRGGVVANLNPESKTKDTASYYVPFSMNLGAAYELKLGRIWLSAPSFLGKTSVTFMADWKDVTNVFFQDDYLNHRNAILDFSAGVQLSIANIFKLRAGMSEMLPAVGIGFDFGAIELDAAYYGREFGREPGQKSAAALDVTLAIRPGAKKKNWPWTQGSLVGFIQNVSSKKAPVDTE